MAPQWQGSLFTFDTAEPASPQLLFSPEEGLHFVMRDFFSYFIDGDYVYLPVINGSINGGVGAVYLSDPANPLLQSTYETGDYQVMDMTGQDSYLYVLAQGETTKIHILGISAPYLPFSEVILPEAASKIAVSGDTLYAARDGWNCNSLYTIDVSNPYSAEITGQWQITVRAKDLVAAGDGLFFLPTSDEGVWVLDVSDPADLYLAGRIQLYSYVHVPRLKVQDGVVYVAAFDGGLYVLVSD